MEIRLGSYMIEFIIKECIFNSSDYINKIIIKDLLGFTLEEFKININSIFDLNMTLKYFFEYSAQSSISLVDTIYDKVIFTCLTLGEDHMRIIFDKYNVYQNTIKNKYIIDMSEEDFYNFGETLEYIFLEATGRSEDDD